MVTEIYDFDYTEKNELRGGSLPILQQLDSILPQFFSNFSFLNSSPSSHPQLIYLIAVSFTGVLKTSIRTTNERAYQQFWYVCMN